MINTIIQFILDIIEQSGYIGIFIFMAIESSIFPLPSEVVMIPAGYLVWQDKMNPFFAILAGTCGSLTGALCNYFLAMKIGRIFVVKYGKYFFMKEKSLITAEKFFDKHGEISTFVGRLIPVVRHYISLPAGIAKMNLWKFCFFTLLGALVWVSILTLFGWWVGNTFSDIDINLLANSFGKNATSELQQTIKAQMRSIIIWILCGIAIITLFYIIWQKRKKNK